MFRRCRLWRRSGATSLYVERIAKASRKIAPACRGLTESIKKLGEPERVDSYPRLVYRAGFGDVAVLRLYVERIANGK